MSYSFLRIQNEYRLFFPSLRTVSGILIFLPEHFTILKKDFVRAALEWLLHVSRTSSSHIYENENMKERIIPPSFTL